jgi:hypothetical protein
MGERVRRQQVPMIGARQSLSSFALIENPASATSRL